MRRSRVPKSIVIIVTDPSTLRILVSPQVEALTKNGWKVSVICGRGEVSNLRFDGEVQFFQINSLVRSINPIADLKCLFELFIILSAIRPNISLVSTPKASYLGSIVSFALRVPRRIYQIRGARWELRSDFTSKILKTTDFLSLLLSSELLAVSPSLKRLYEKQFPLKKEISVLGKGSSKGVSEDIFFPPDFFTLDTITPIFGFVGRLTVDKGIDDLLIIFKLLKLRFPKARLEIIGSQDDTDPISMKTLESIIDSDGIQLFENLSPADVALRIQSWVVQIFPSHREGLPNAVIEAAACGTPTIGWKIGGVLDSIHPKYSDFALEIGEFEVAANKIEEILTNPGYLSIRSDFSSWTHENFSEAKVQFNLINYLETKG